MGEPVCLSFFVFFFQPSTIDGIHIAGLKQKTSHTCMLYSDTVYLISLAHLRRTTVLLAYCLLLLFLERVERLISQRSFIDNDVLFRANADRITTGCDTLVPFIWGTGAVPVGFVGSPPPPLDTAGVLLLEQRRHCLAFNLTLSCDLYFSLESIFFVRSAVLFLR